MKKLCRRMKLAGVVLGAGLSLFSGCGVLPNASPVGNQTCDKAMLEIAIDSIASEGVSIAWDPALVAVGGAEVSVDGNGSGTVVVTVELRPAD